MLIDKHNIKAIVNEQDELRPYTQVILFRENETVTTDGHILIKVPYPEVNTEDFPLPDDVYDTNKVEHGFKVPINTLNKLEKTLPKGKNIHKVLKTVYAFKENINDDNVYLYTDHNKSVITDNVTYPDIDPVIPSGEDAVITIAFSIDLMYKLLSALRKGRNYDKNTSIVQFKLLAPDRAMLFKTTEGLSGVIMPIRDPDTGFSNNNEDSKEE